MTIGIVLLVLTALAVLLPLRPTQRDATHRDAPRRDALDRAAEHPATVDALMPALRQIR